MKEMIKNNRNWDVTIHNSCGDEGIVTLNNKTFDDAVESLIDYAGSGQLKASKKFLDNKLIRFKVEDKSDRDIFYMVSEHKALK